MFIGTVIEIARDGNKKYVTLISDDKVEVCFIEQNPVVPHIVGKQYMVRVEELPEECNGKGNGNNN